MCNSANLRKHANNWAFFHHKIMVKLDLLCGVVVRVRDESISLPDYSARMNIQLFKAVDFNEKIRERGADEDVTVQHIYRIAKDEH